MESMDKSLEQFMAVTELGSFVAAAERLLVSQPALTYSIKKLEENLGVRLFERSSRGVRLTAYGETLYKNSLIMRRLYSNALETIERQKSEFEHGISIGTGYSSWTLFLKDFVVAHFRDHPNAPINVSIGNAMRCMDQLWAGDISLFVGHQIQNLVREVDIDFIPLGLAKDGYFVRQDHPLLGQSRRLSDIYAYPTTMAFPPESRQKRLLVDSAVTVPQPDRFGHAFTSNSMRACMDFVRETDSVLIHSDLLADSFTEHGLIQVVIDSGEMQRSWLLGIYVLPERRADPHVRKFIELIRLGASKLDLQTPL
ncbi:LysR family transcriptional regulator [Aliirhizobium smilacinae]|uniref:LysR family transcriptional regulator n=2 Tax=Aliirhizobium smilacinae TaxID=1395944 RepID=A0A5C4XKG8_9HYPH|nr:LysR family transcriptional regulator [Rhizobium smilacinae]